MATEATRDHYTRVGQVNTRYWVSGDGGPAVVLLHGLGSFVEHWGHNIDVLARGHRVYAVDMVGFGRSDKPRLPYSVPLLTDFVHDFMDTQGMARASLVGNSMGGGVALQLAARYPDRVDRLVLVDSVGFGQRLRLTYRLAAMPIVGELLLRAPTRRLVARVLREVVRDPALATDELFETTCEISELPGLRESFVAALRSLIDMGPIVGGPATVRAPTLIVWGEQDRVLPVAQAHAAARLLPGARVCILDACGHMPQLERPEEFNAVVGEFLEG